MKVMALGIVCIFLLEAIALATGHNGYMFNSAVIGISGISGSAMGLERFRKWRYKVNGDQDKRDRD